MLNKTLIALTSLALTPLAAAVSSQAYTWRNVKIGGGGGFVPGIVFNPSQQASTACIYYGLLPLSRPGSRLRSYGHRWSL